MERIYNYINGVKDARPKAMTREKFHALCKAPRTRKLVGDYQKGDGEAKRKLPAAMFLGFQTQGDRIQEHMEPTQLYLIDIDHISDKNEDMTPETVWEKIRQEMEEAQYDFKVRLVHKTPSGDGLRVVLHATEGFETLEEHAEWLRKKLDLDRYGKFDCLKNLDRVSFLVPEEYLFFESPCLWDETEEGGPIKRKTKAEGRKTKDEGRKTKDDNHNVNENNSQLSTINFQLDGDSEPILWEGYDIQKIIDDRYRRGVPGSGSISRHDQSLKLARDLLIMFDRDKSLVYRILLRQQWIRDIIKERNEPVEETIDAALNYANGKDGGKYALTYRYLTPATQNSILHVTGKTWKEWMEELDAKYDEPLEERNENVNENDNENYDDDENEDDAVATMPPAPPVIRELISIAPKDFVVPAIGALMPILGTLTSYVRAEDKQDNKTISTTFFSIIYAPPSSGKSFVESYINYLMRDLFRRDELNDARDDVYARSDVQRSQSEHGEPLPLTTTRIMEAKSSETEFLQKQRNNRGHHMFTYCSEIDQWRKGVRAAGGNKDDMIRIAWDNGRYGQKYKSTNSFKGKVNLYWNVLIAGTDDQLQAYFKNVTNGLVTRCCFQEILNQEFQEDPPVWKTLNKKDRKVIDCFIEKCDRMTYTEPLTYDVEQCYSVADKDFDAEVPWRMDFKPLTNSDIDWIIPTVVRFNREQCRKAMKDNDKARDTFRRRVGTRAKRLALLCTQLYEKPMTQADKRACAKWIAWWMEQDIKGIMRPFANKYVKAIEASAPDNTPRRTLFERLPEEFSKEDVRRTADILGYSSPVKLIVTNWIKINVIEKMAKNRWKKVSTK